jgi:uncharacterized protein with HEPN domain
MDRIIKKRLFDILASINQIESYLHQESFTYIESRGDKTY